MRTATNKKVPANTNKSTSKSIKPIAKRIASSKVAKSIPKSVIEKPKTQVATPSSTPIPSPLKTPNKQSQLIALLKDPKGADIKLLMQATGWQPHSIRGIISGVLRKKLGLEVVHQKEGSNSIYRIASAAQ